MTAHGLVSRRRYGGVAEVQAIASSVGCGHLPAAGVAIRLADGTVVDLPQLLAVPFLSVGDEQARRAAAWWSDRLGVPCGDLIDWG